LPLSFLQSVANDPSKAVVISMIECLSVYRTQEMLRKFDEVLKKYSRIVSNEVLEAFFSCYSSISVTIL